MGTRSPRTWPQIGILFSGAAAVGYQILWQCQIALIVGCQSSFATLTVCAFIGGMAGGAALSGRMADQLTSRQAFSVLFAIEILTALTGLSSPSLLYGISQMGWSLALLGAFAFVAVGSFLWD
jgi:hypothetical protein